MSHPRIAIREAARLALLGKTPAADRVSTNRAKPLLQRPMERSEEEELPAILLYTRNEQSEIFDTAPRRYRRRLDLVVEILAEVIDVLDDELDDLAWQVETLLLLDDTLGGTANDLKVTASTTSTADTGERMLGAAIITFEVEYFTDAPVPGSDELYDFSTLITRYSLGGQQAEPEQAQTNLENLDQ